LDGDRVDAQFPFVVDISATREGNSEEIARLAVTVFISYLGASKFSVDDLRHFVGVSGFMHAWPYLRAEAQSLTTKIGLPPLLLPLIVSGAVPSKVAVGLPLVVAGSPKPELPAKKRAKRAKPVKAGKKAQRKKKS
ncbi:MAG TPA: hypothetical protein VER04_14490, partial [Polyangiaceae bacterium]|nr:hypothetical protein [Polyangiaceae bacterium]